MTNELCPYEARTARPWTRGLTGLAATLVEWAAFGANRPIRNAR